MAVGQIEGVGLRSELPPSPLASLPVHPLSLYDRRTRSLLFTEVASTSFWFEMPIFPALMRKPRLRTSVVFHGVFVSRRACSFWEARGVLLPPCGPSSRSQLSIESPICAKQIRCTSDALLVRLDALGKLGALRATLAEDLLAACDGSIHLLYEYLAPELRRLCGLVWSDDLRVFLSQGTFGPANRRIRPRLERRPQPPIAYSQRMEAWRKRGK